MDLNSPRLHFNWGFHDAANDLRKDRGFKPGGVSNPQGPHFMPSYEQGYRAGYAAAQRGESTESSELAWTSR